MDGTQALGRSVLYKLLKIMVVELLELQVIEDSRVVGVDQLDLHTL